MKPILSLTQQLIYDILGSWINHEYPYPLDSSTHHQLHGEVPDSTFVEMLPQPVVFPRHVASEWVPRYLKSNPKPYRCDLRGVQSNGVHSDWLVIVNIMALVDRHINSVRWFIWAAQLPMIADTDVDWALGATGCTITACPLLFLERDGRRRLTLLMATHGLAKT